MAGPQEALARPPYVMQGKARHHFGKWLYAFESARLTSTQFRMDVLFQYPFDGDALFPYNATTNSISLLVGEATRSGPSGFKRSVRIIVKARYDAPMLQYEWIVTHPSMDPLVYPKDFNVSSIGFDLNPRENDVTSSEMGVAIRPRSAGDIWANRPLQWNNGFIPDFNGVLRYVSPIEWSSRGIDFESPDTFFDLGLAYLNSIREDPEKVNVPNHDDDMTHEEQEAQIISVIVQFDYDPNPVISGLGGRVIPRVLSGPFSRKKKGRTVADPSVNFVPVGFAPDGTNIIGITVEPEDHTKHPWAGKGNKAKYAVSLFDDDKYGSPRQGVNLVLEYGKTYTFDVSDVPKDHPFFITGDEVGGSQKDNPLEHIKKITEPTHRKSSQKIVTFTPTARTPHVNSGRIPGSSFPSNHVYGQCSEHQYMGFPISLIGRAVTSLFHDVHTDAMVSMDRNGTIHVDYSDDDGSSKSFALMEDALHELGLSIDTKAVFRLGRKNEVYCCKIKDVEGVSQPEALTPAVLVDGDGKHLCKHVLSVGELRSWLSKAPASARLCPMCNE